MRRWIDIKIVAEIEIVKKKIRGEINREKYDQKQVKRGPQM